MDAKSASFQAIGTNWDIHITEGIDAKEWAQLITRIDRRISDFDKTYSRFRTDSLVTKISKKAGSYTMPEDGSKMVQFYQDLYDATDGKVTPLIGKTMEDAGYDASYSFQIKNLRKPHRWEDVLSYDSGRITVSEPALLDFGAAGKGYLIDIIGQIIEEDEIKNYLINAGGDMRFRSSEEENIDVGMENPFDASEAIGVVKLDSRSLCASSGGKRKWGSIHHIIDPESLDSPHEVAATWVIASDTMTADGLATALFLHPVHLLLSKFTFSYAILMHNMKLIRAKDFPVTTFEAQA